MDDLINGVSEQLVLDEKNDDVSMIDWNGDEDKEVVEDKGGKEETNVDAVVKEDKQLEIIPFVRPTTRNAVAPEWADDARDLGHYSDTGPHHVRHDRESVVASAGNALWWLVVGVATALMVAWTTDVAATRAVLRGRTALRAEKCYALWAANGCGRPVPALAEECAQWLECWAVPERALWVDAVLAVGRRVWPLVFLILFLLLLLLGLGLGRSRGPGQAKFASH